MVPLQSFRLQHETLKMQNLFDWLLLCVFIALVFFLNPKVKIFTQKPLLYFHSVAKNPRKPLNGTKLHSQLLSKTRNTKESAELQLNNLSLSSNTYYSSALIIYLWILLLMIRHRFPDSFPEWTSLLSLLLVRTALNWEGLSCPPSSPKQQALTKGEKAVTTRDRTTVSRLSFRPDGSYLTRKEVLCSKHVYFIYIHQTLPAPSSCSTHTNWIQLSRLVYNNKLKYNVISNYIQTFLSKQKHSEVGKKVPLNII